MSTTRRRFLSQCAGAAAGAWILPAVSHATASSAPNVKFPADPRGRVAVASYPFREFIAGKEHKSGNPMMELKDFAAHVADKFNVHHIEPWSPHFPSTDSKYLEQFRAAADKAQSSVVDIAVDGRFSQYALDAAEREQAVSYSKQWIDIAIALGSPSIRTHIHEAKDSKPDVGRTADTLTRVVEYGSARNVVLHLENDDPVSEDPFFIAQVIEKVNSPWLHALPDFGNSVGAHDEDYAYRGVDAMFAHAYGICHVKSGAVDEQGKVVPVDLGRTFAILKKHDYKGYCSIEYDQPGDPYKTTAELVETTVKFLS